MKSRSLACAVALLLAACTRPLLIAPPPATVHTIAVFPPRNLTGSDQIVEGGSLLEKYAFDTPAVTVADVLAADARMKLASRGLTVVAPRLVAAAVGLHAPTSAQEAAKQAAANDVDAAVLFIEIRRWEPDVPFHPSFIIVSLAATLIDATSDKVLWKADLPSRPIATPGVVNPGEASLIAATKAVEMLLADFGSPAHAKKPAPVSLGPPQSLDGRGLASLSSIATPS